MQLPHGEEPVRQARFDLLLLGLRQSSHQGLATFLQLPLLDLQRSPKIRKTYIFLKRSLCPRSGVPLHQKKHIVFFGTLQVKQRELEERCQSLVTAIPLTQQEQIESLQRSEKNNKNYYFFQKANQLGEEQPRPLVALVQLPHGEEPVRGARLDLLLLGQRDSSHQGLATFLQLPLLDLQRFQKNEKNIHFFKKEFVSKVRRSPPPKEAVDQWRSGGALPLIWGKAATRAIPFFHKNKYVQR